MVRDRLYGDYVSQHAGRSDSRAAELIYRRNIRPELPAPGTGPVADIGCGQGDLVRLLLRDGYDAIGVDVSPEQVGLARSAGLDRVVEGDYRDVLRACPGQFSAVTATDLLEHLPKDEVLEAFDLVAAALSPGGVFVARVPNAVSPFGGHIRYGDFTHETWFTASCVRQLANASGFGAVRVLACPPAAHGPLSAGRAIVWSMVSAAFKVALAAETGVTRGHVVTQNLTFVARRRPEGLG